MAEIRKALIFGFGIWLAIALLEAFLNWQNFLPATQNNLTMIPISIIVIFLGALEYLKGIHAQYEEEGLEIGLIWAGVAIISELFVFSIFYGQGIEYFLNIGIWLGIIFKFIFPLAAGAYMQHRVGI